MAKNGKSRSNRAQELEKLGSVFLSNSEISDQVRRWVQQGNVRRIGPRLYTKSVELPDETIVRSNIWNIVSLYFPGAILAAKTSLIKAPSENGNVWVFSEKPRIVTLPGHLIISWKGSTLPDDEPFVHGLMSRSPAQTLLDNQRTKPKGKRTGESASLTPEEVELYLERLLNNEPGKQTFLELQERLAKEGPSLTATMIALRGEGGTRLVTASGRARARGEAIDLNRERLFTKLAEYLVTRPSEGLISNPGQDRRAVAFYEAYFSNYIEGTRFNLEEAREMVFEGRVPANRRSDADCVMETYRLIVEDPGADYSTYDEFETRIREIHRRLMSSKPEADPGRFKATRNWAGDYLFVSPDHVRGTLRAGYELSLSIPPGLSRAIYLSFLIAETHPFVDGNGRVSRLILNAELEQTERQRIIIPTVYRDNYIQALRAANQSDHFLPLARAMAFAQEFTGNMKLTSIYSAQEEFKATNAFQEPGEVRLKMPRA